MTDEVTPKKPLADMLTVVEVERRHDFGIEQGKVVRFRYEKERNQVTLDPPAEALQAEIFLPKGVVLDEGIIAVSRHVLHNLLVRLAEATKDWDLEDTEFFRLVPSRQPKTEGSVDANDEMEAVG